jgi:hypothetical protein
MSTSKGLGVVVAMFGVLILAAGGVRLRKASGLREGAGDILQRQREAQATFHRNAEEVSKRYQAGELDEAAWRSATEAVSERFRTDSNAAGVAWIEQLALAGRTQRQGFALLFLGLFSTVVGYMLAARSTEVSQPNVADKA